MSSDEAQMLSLTIKICPLSLPPSKTFVVLCTSDADCARGSYCTSKKVCTAFFKDYCDTNSCGLGDAGSCFLVFGGIRDKLSRLSDMDCALEDYQCGRPSISASLPCVYI